VKAALVYRNGMAISVWILERLIAISVKAFVAVVHKRL